MGERPLARREFTLPTGTAIPDVRNVLFAAAERVLAKAGPAALTTRAVTDEAGVAKGVLHRCFPDFDAFLTELVRQRTTSAAQEGLRLEGRAGEGTVVGNLSGFFADVFDPVGLALVGLVIAREELRARLRAQTAGGLPFLADVAVACERYLQAEQEVGRIDPDVDSAALALTLVGTAHLLFAGEHGATPDAEAVREVLSAALVGVMR